VELLPYSPEAMKLRARGSAVSELARIHAIDAGEEDGVAETGASECFLLPVSSLLKELF
jgi:hypothetical protein